MLLGVDVGGTFTDAVLVLEDGAIVTGKAGLIAARELSRLVRDNQDWSHVVRLCRFENVLLADEQRLYDPADAQDRMVLGIQGAFNEFELSMILDRMQQSLRQKAERGEQWDALPSGYVCRHSPLCEKHPDPSVQRAVQKVKTMGAGELSTWSHIYNRSWQQGQSGQPLDIYVDLLDDGDYFQLQEHSSQSKAAIREVFGAAAST